MFVEIQKESLSARKAFLFDHNLSARRHMDGGLRVAQKRHSHERASRMLPCHSIRARCLRVSTALPSARMATPRPMKGKPIDSTSRGGNESSPVKPVSTANSTTIRFPDTSSKGIVRNASRAFSPTRPRIVTTNPQRPLEPMRYAGREAPSGPTSKMKNIPPGRLRSIRPEASKPPLSTSTTTNFPSCSGPSFGRISPRPEERSHFLVSASRS